MNKTKVLSFSITKPVDMEAFVRQMFFILLTLCLMAPYPAVYATDYLFPLHTEDLHSGERVYTSDHAGGIQRRGKDIIIRRYTSDGNWTSLTADAPSDTQDRENRDSLAYGRPFYAIADGEVVGCWRNAPENPRPGEAHPMRDDIGDKFIFGGGNHLWVRQDDGIIVLYAHAIPGTIPASLCPYDQQFADSPVGGGGYPDVDPQAFVPEGVSPSVPTAGTVVRPRIVKGQMLGRIGNSGSSSGPHLHIHAEKIDPATGRTSPAHMVFEHGLFKFFKQGSTGLNGWHSFSDNTLPNGKILIWPPVLPTSEYTRHGLSLNEYNKVATHLENSGFMPVLLDCYSVGGEMFVNASWHPTPPKVKWVSFIDVPRSEYQQRFSDAVRQDPNNPSDNLKPVLVESCSSAKGQRYAAIFTNEAGPALARHGLTYRQHQQLFNEQTAKGFVPVSIAVVERDGARDYTVLYHAASDANIGRFRLKSRLQRTSSVDQYQDAFNDADNDNLHPIYLNSYLFKGQQNFVAIFAQRPQGPVFARHNLSGAQFQQAFDQAVGDGMQTQSITAFDGANTKHIFAGAWLPK